MAAQSGTRVQIDQAIDVQSCIAFEVGPLRRARLLLLNVFHTATIVHNISDQVSQLLLERTLGIGQLMDAQVSASMSAR